MEINEIYVPGHLECPKCKFYLIKSTLFVKSGTLGANSTPDDCANGCGPMWKVSWKSHSMAMIERVEQLEEKYKERGMAMRESGNTVRSLFIPYLRRIKKALLMPEDLDALTAIAGVVKELEAHTTIGGDDSED